MKKTIVFNLLLFIGFSVHSQNNNTLLIRDFIEKTLEKSEIVPSLSVIVVSDETVLFQNTFGYRNWEQKIPANDESQYYIASCTKAFTALLIHILANEGKIDLNTSITDYNPFKNFKNKAIFENITIQDLLSHQSGIDNAYLSFRLAYTGEYTHQEILTLIENETKKNETGKAFEYTNFGYYLLDYILQAELGKSWKDLLQEKVFQPLEMDNTTAYMSKVHKDKLALPHLGIFNENIKVSPIQKTDALMHTAGGLVSNVKDAGKFLQFYLSGGNGIYPKIVVQKSYEQQVTAKHEFVRVFEGKGYASGWRLGHFENENIVYHFGGYTGYFAHYSFIPEKNIGMAIFSNTDMGMTAANLVSKYIYNLYLGNKGEVKSALKQRDKTIPKALSKERKAQAKHQEKMASRVWNLSLPKEMYTGIYTNEKLGKVNIRFKNGQFIVCAGNLITTATPFPSEDTMRVELIPGSGTIIGFEVKNNKVISLFNQREVFQKQD